MNQDTISSINRLNNDFYRTHHESFNQSRQSAWPGWSRIAGQIASCKLEGIQRLLDIACGNMRFERYIVESLPELEMQAFCVDSCDELAQTMDGCEYLHDDIVTTLTFSETRLHPWGTGYDIVVSFGFFHHVPSLEMRMRLLDTLIESAATDSLIALSLWRFAADDKLREKALKTTAEALSAHAVPNDLEENDYLLGWNDTPGAYRYCHSFDDSEIDEFVSHVNHKARLIDRFRSDGRTGALNEYLVWQRF